MVGTVQRFEAVTLIGYTWIEETDKVAHLPLSRLRSGGLQEGDKLLCEEQSRRGTLAKYHRWCVRQALWAHSSHTLHARARIPYLVPVTAVTGLAELGGSSPITRSRSLL